MRVPTNNLSLSKSRSEHSLIDLKSDAITKQICVPMICDDRQSSTSEVSNYSSLSSSVSASSAVYTSRSSFGYGSLKETQVSPSSSGNRSATPSSKQVQRFGEGCKDNCLFPLSLTVNATEFLKGRSTWASLLIAAEEALIQWEGAAKFRKKTVNRFLDEVSYISPLSALESETLLSPQCKLPLRRYCSDIDLRKSRKDRKCKQSNLARRRSLLELDEIISFENRFKCSEDEYQKDDDSLNEMEVERSQPNTFLLKPIGSKRIPKNVTKNSRMGEKSRKNVSTKSDAKTLISTIKLDHPISVGIQLTNVDKMLFSQLSAEEVFQVVIGKEKCLFKNKLENIKKLIAFREEVKRMVINVITAERTVELRSRKMAAFIEVACVLRKLRNWNSLECIMKALQSPHIYVLETAWSHTATTYPIHFGDYLKLTKFVHSCDQKLIRTSESQPSIPSLKSFIQTFRTQCLAQYDLIVCKRRWTEADNLVDWMEKQLKEMVVKRRSSNECKSEAVSLHPKRFSMLPYNDTIRFISLDSLPFSSFRTELRSVSSTHYRALYKFFVSSFNEELNLIKYYALIKTPAKK